MPDYTTVRALPYSTGAESVNSIDETMQELAERLDLLLPRSGITGNLAVSAAGATNSVAVVFPTAYPVGVIPRVQVTAMAANPDVKVSHDAVTNTGFTLYYRRDSGASNIAGATWTAVAP